MTKKLSDIFSSPKPVIGMLHIDDLPGTPNFKNINYLVQRAKNDIQALQEGGINGILIENWKEDSIGEFVSEQTAKGLEQVLTKIIGAITVPFGINILNNDYKIALTLAKKFKASFVQLDVFVDHVMSNFVHSPTASKHPFEIKPNPHKIRSYATKIGAGSIPLFVFVQPKHYKMLEKNKPIEKSVKQAGKEGAAAILVTKETGTAPTIDLIKRAKAVAGDMPVGIGSGFSSENAKEYLNVADFAIVGTSIKIHGKTDNPVDKNTVCKLMNVVRNQKLLSLLENINGEIKKLEDYSRKTTASAWEVSASAAASPSQSGDKYHAEHQAEITRENLERLKLLKEEIENKIKNPISPTPKTVTLEGKEYFLVKNTANIKGVSFISINSEVGRNLLLTSSAQ